MPLHDLVTGAGAATIIVTAASMYYARKGVGVRAVRRWLHRLNIPAQDEALKLIREGLGLGSDGGADHQLRERAKSLVQGVDQWRAVETRVGRLHLRLKAAVYANALLLLALVAWAILTKTPDVPHVAILLKWSMAFWALAFVSYLGALFPIAQLWLENSGPTEEDRRERELPKADASPKEDHVPPQGEGSASASSVQNEVVTKPKGRKKPAK